MRSKEFIIERINALVKEIPNLKCRYEYNAESFTHFIEVKPLSYYQNDQSYFDIEEKMYVDFRREFPGESICFISEDSPYQISEPIYIKSGSEDSFMKTVLEHMRSLANLRTRCDVWVGSTFNSSRAILHKSPRDIIMDKGIHGKPLSDWEHLLNYKASAHGLARVNSYTTCLDILNVFDDYSSNVIVKTNYAKDTDVSTVDPPRYTTKEIKNEKALESPKPFLISPNGKIARTTSLSL